jgi:hypothetical protein
MALAIAEAVSSMQRAHADDAVAIHAEMQTPTTDCPTSTWTVVAETACGGVILDPSDFITIAVHGLLTNEKRLGPADDDVYRRLVGKLRQDSRDV